MIPHKSYRVHGNALLLLSPFFKFHLWLAQIVYCGYLPTAFLWITNFEVLFLLPLKELPANGWKSWTFNGIWLALLSAVLCTYVTYKICDCVVWIRAVQADVIRLIVSKFTRLVFPLTSRDQLIRSFIKLLGLKLHIELTSVLYVAVCEWWFVSALAVISHFPIGDLPPTNPHEHEQ